MRVLIVLFALMTAACGFAPMYAQPGGQSAIGPVTVAPIPGKAGHVLRTELTRLLAVESGGAEPSHLEITLVESVIPLGIQLDETATRAEFHLAANYALTPPRGRVIRGAIATIADYEIPTAAYGEVAAQDDARERAAEVMAQRFRAELALRMAQAREGAAQ
ncbi:MAG: hypothetical protein JNK94_02310 [Hyphomonadaceae bacterium]|nr:hypothetical protein [Hyphomonadaceae bacterium]